MRRREKRFARREDPVKERERSILGESIRATGTKIHRLTQGHMCDAEDHKSYAEGQLCDAKDRQGDIGVDLMMQEPYTLMQGRFVQADAEGDAEDRFAKRLISPVCRFSLWD